ncbi:VOC family protein [Sphingomicrobium nitratireducens]|uniref:VOC family protein n=1 Tax=Sphingomicrobium nitratireducens TaxID=2964666 RepID=UPI002240CDBB|nr:VOC family protein [Sphingomicrobium nitratireducens]
MIGYVTLGTDDLERARAFYDALLELIGVRRLMTLDNGFTIYAESADEPAICLTRPQNGEPATDGNGQMVALRLDSRRRVRELHEKALKLGGLDEGAPGYREPEEMGFYAAYFRDPDGHKLCVYALVPKAD